MSKKTADTKESIQPVAIAADQREPLYRHVKIERKDISGEKSDIVQLAAASEYPNQMRAKKVHVLLGIAKQEGQEITEILSHADGDYDLSRFNDGNNAAFLDEHVDSRHLGHIRKGFVGEDKVTRVSAQFDLKTKLSRTRHSQMTDGSRPNVSLGYSYTKYLGARALDDGRLGHVFAWEGLEVSNVAVPADPTVGLGRKAGQAHCIRCGDVFARKDLNDDYMCEDCEAAETPADDDTQDDAKNEDARKKERETRTAEQFAKTELWKACGILTLTRKGKRDDEMGTHSHKEIEAGVRAAAYSHKAFKRSDENGNKNADFWIHDIHRVLGEDASSYVAYIVGPSEGPPSYNRVVNEVPFTYDGAKVEMGDATPVRSKQTWEPIAAGHRKVDFEKLKRAAQPPNQKFMPKSIAELEQDSPELVKQIRTDTDKQTRKAVLDEVTLGRTAAEGKRQTRNTEILSIGEAWQKDHGHKWNGKPGDKYVIGIRAAELIRKACDEPVEGDKAKDNREIRSDLKEGLAQLLAGATEPKNQEEAGHLPQELAGRCSLRRFYNEGAKAAESVSGRSQCFMLTTGAEKEAHDEIHHRAKEFPGGKANLGAGMLLPFNMPANGVNRNMTRNQRDRMMRDSLAGDYGSAGALIAPQFKFPTIELLRNWAALPQAGMTVLSGVMGDLVLPRQTSATKAQSVAEGAALAEYDQTYDQIRMAPKRGGSMQKYSRLALLQTSEDFEAMVLADHMAQNALYIDELCLNGTGAGDQPLGLMNQVGIGSIPFQGSAANAFKNAVAMETLIRSSNIKDTIDYISTSTGRGTLSTVARLLIGATTVVASPVWDAENETINGRSAHDSQQVPNGALIAGAFRHAVLAMWGGWAVVLDTLTLADQDKYKLSINYYFDFALRHPQAIVRSPDSVEVLS